MSRINDILETGRRLRAAESELVRMSPRDPGRGRLSQQASQLQTAQTGQIADALAAGVAEDTIRFALELHGQGADRQPWSTEPTPAEQLLELMTRHGAPAVVEAIDAARTRADADADGL